MCKIGDIILIYNARNRRPVGPHPFIVLDENRSQYIDGLKQYREEHSINRLAALMQIEADDYYKQCEYFMG